MPTTGSRTGQGGPSRIPGAIRPAECWVARSIKNKTFFFAMYEFTEAKSPLTSTRTVPTLLQRQGDFSQTRNAPGR